MRPEDDAFAFLRRRQDLLLVRNTYLYVALTGKPPRLVEEGEVILVDVRAVPVAGPFACHENWSPTEARRGDERASPRQSSDAAGWIGSAARDCGGTSARCGSAAAAEERVGRMAKGEEGARASAAPSSPYL